MGPAPHMANELFASLSPNCCLANLQRAKNAFVHKTLHPGCFIVKRIPFHFYFERHHRFPHSAGYKYDYRS
jgi:hypothetical protein